MAITLVGIIPSPVDNGSQALSGQSVTTALLTFQTGDLCVMVGMQRNAGGSVSLNATGGQSWLSYSLNASSATLGVSVFWCRYNGTWSADPSVTYSSSTSTSLYMLVYRPTNTTKLWGIDTGWGTNGLTSFAAPSSPFTVTLTFGAAPTNPSTVAIGIWTTDDDNIWGTLSGSGWSKTSLGAQYRNLAGNDTSATFAYNIQTSAGSIANVSQNGGADGGIVGTFVFYEYDNVPARIPRPTSVGHPFIA
jgi:hypothetical protein